ncbi:hypothetical protein PtB15_6B445 [Puccinia triticina]|nr:hypothetical protein PtB15_6B445 [Puccinia triticina]
MTGAERDAAAQRDPRQVWARTGLNGGQGGQGLDYLQAGAQAMQPGALGGAIRACDPGGRRVWDRHAHAGPLPPARLGLLKRRRCKSELLLAIYELGQCFLRGWGSKKDKQLFPNGKGTKKDLKLAAKYYRMAANQGMEMMGSQWVWKDKVRPSPSLPSQ